MAGDWIKMRVDLDEDPSVIGIAERLGVSETQVVGWLWKVWAWADGQTRDGNAASVTGKWIDRYTGAPGLSEAMISVGWLVVSDAGISIPNFGKHNGSPAKTRALTLDRVREHRNAASVTESLPEKRRVNTPLPPKGGCAARGPQRQRRREPKPDYTNPTNIVVATPEQIAAADREKARKRAAAKNGGGPILVLDSEAAPLPLRTSEPAKPTVGGGVA